MLVVELVGELDCEDEDVELTTQDASVHDDVGDEEEEIKLLVQEEEDEDDTEDDEVPELLELRQDASVQDEDPELEEEVGDEEGSDVAHGILKMDVVVWQPVWQVVSQNVVVGRLLRQVQGWVTSTSVMHSSIVQLLGGDGQPEPPV